MKWRWLNIKGISNTNIKTDQELNRFNSINIKTGQEINRVKQIDIALGQEIHRFANINMATGQEKNRFNGINIALSQERKISAVFDVLNNKIFESIGITYMMSTSTINISDLRQKLTLDYFNNKTFADFNNKEMQEIVYDIVGWFI